MAHLMFALPIVLVSLGSWGWFRAIQRVLLSGGWLPVKTFLNGKPTAVCLLWLFLLSQALGMTQNGVMSSKSPTAGKGGFVNNGKFDCHLAKKLKLTRVTSQYIKGNTIYRGCKSILLTISIQIYRPPTGQLSWQSVGLPCGRSRVRAPDRTNTQGLKITEENVLPLYLHLQMVRHSSLLG